MKVVDGGGFKCIYLRTVHQYNDVINCTEKSCIYTRMTL